MSIFLPINLPESKYIFYWDKQRSHLEELIYGQNKHNRSHNLHEFQAQTEAKIEDLTATKILVLDFINVESLYNSDNFVDNSVEILASFLGKIKRKLKNFKIMIIVKNENWENSEIYKALENSNLDYTLEILENADSEVDKTLTQSQQVKICHKLALSHKIENRQVVYLNLQNELEFLKFSLENSTNQTKIVKSEDLITESFSKSEENSSKIIYKILAQTLTKLSIDADLLAIYGGNSGELKKQLNLTLDIYLTFLTRDNIQNFQKRIDGRKLDETRQILSQVGVLPHNHGSSLFSRGETQVLNVLTLGTAADAQTLDDMENCEEETKNYIHHYNFPSYSVGETGRYFGPGRREIGHGALAEKALLPVLPSLEKFPYTMRLVSECLGSNGSTSMASTCASTLSLLQGGVPITDSVAGVAMGLVLNN